MIGGETLEMRRTPVMAGRNSSARGGFTLVEAMVLLVIIAFLLAMAVMALQRIRQKNQESGGADRPAPAAAAPPAAG
jgi:type II secretory pathway component PulJ